MVKALVLLFDTTLKRSAVKDNTWNHTEIRGKVVFFKLSNDPAALKSLKDFIHHREKTIRAAAFS